MILEGNVLSKALEFVEEDREKRGPPRWTWSKRKRE